MDIYINTSQRGILSIALPEIARYEDNGDNPDISELRFGVQVLGPDNYAGGLAESIYGYLKGEKVLFGDYPLVWDGIGPFQKKVLMSLPGIPYGTTISYKKLAEAIGSPNASRAVGQALKRNPWPILLPCHRVICKDGDLGGFSSGPGWKRLLLMIEGIKR